MLNMNITFSNINAIKTTHAKMVFACAASLDGFFKVFKMLVRQIIYLFHI